MEMVRGPGANFLPRRGVRVGPALAAAVVLSCLAACSSTGSSISPDAWAPDAERSHGEASTGASEDGSIGHETEASHDAEGQRDAAGTRDGASDGGDDLSLEAIVARYATWQARSEPQSISAYIFGICRAPTAHEQAYADGEHGRQRYLRDWVNAEAAAGFAADGGVPFGAGATIVKEKLVPAGSGLALAALGIMTKRRPGFDPAQGDWEYGYWEESLGIVRGSELAAHCGGCHAGAQNTDYVFFDLSWLRE